MGDDGDGVPRAYLNYLLFDEDYVLIDQGFAQVSRAAEVAVQGRSTQANSSPAQASHQMLELEVAAEQSGYLYTYLSNESNWDVNVYFDEFTVAQQSYIVQVNDYYPFGLTHQQPIAGQLKNKYLYNGKELQDELGLGWYDYGARMYQPDLGRWHVVDPMSDKMFMISPYSYSFNNPILYQDKDSALPIIPLIVKAGANGAADMMLQVAMNYYFDDKVTSLNEAFNQVNWWQVGRSSAEGLIPWRTPGGGLGRAAGTAVGDVLVNAANQGAYYRQEQALQDFAVGFIGDLAGGGIGELTGKYGARAVARGLGSLGLDAKKIENLTGILDWNFSSSDPLVGDLANSIDNQFGKGTVSDVGEGFETATSSGDLDIVTEKFNIEVKSGRKI